MDESTTTPDQTTDTGAGTAQPEQQPDTGAENQPDVSTNDTDATEAGDSEEPVDENLAWLQNKGIDPQSPEALAKVAEMYRNAEKQMHQSTQEKAQLQTALEQPTDLQSTEYQDDPTLALAAEVQAMKVERSVDRFFTSNPDAKQYEAAMTDIVTSDPVMAELVRGGYFPMDKLYQLAKGADPNREASLKTAGGREALQRVADKQQAKAVAGNATNSQMGASGPTKDNVDTWYAGLTSEQRQSPEVQATVASLLS